MSKFIPQHTPEAKSQMLSSAHSELVEQAKKYHAYLEDASHNPTDENLAKARKAMVELSNLMTRDVIPLINALLPAAPQQQQLNGASAPAVDLNALLS